MKPQDFKPGQTGNPNGRPKKDWTWGSLIDAEAEKLVDSNDPSKGKIKEAITKELVKKAKNGDIQAYREMANRSEGMPKQTTDLTTGGEKIEFYDKQQAEAIAKRTLRNDKDES